MRNTAGMPTVHGDGCPYHETWIILMRTIPGIICFILADNLLVLVEGADMVDRLAQALNSTHEFLNDMGAKVVPAKSYYFANCKKR